jgi:undecaprenyl-diphosphatase
MNMLAIGAGVFAAFLTGIIACTWMIRLVQNSKLKYFSVYCFLVGFIAVSYSIL